MSNGAPIYVPITSYSFKGKTVFVTGASSGIGLETAEVFYALGANIAFICGRKTPPTSIPLSSPRTLQINLSIADWSALSSAFAATYKKFGRIDIVIPNAGVAETPGQYFDLKDNGNGGFKELDMNAVDIDIKGTMNTIALGIHYLKKTKEGGSMVIMSSMAGYEGVNGMPGYSAAKHAATGLLRSLPQRAAESNIAVSLVAPSMTFTPGAFPGSYRPGKEAFEEMKEKMGKVGVHISSAYTCALAVAYLVNKGIGANGAALLVDADEITDLEGELERARPEWFVKKSIEREEAGKAFYALSKANL
jgi:NAD(P)-dependent dehydrogenase (short-subunit alcohol dehydrogenase family)